MNLLLCSTVSSGFQKPVHIDTSRILKYFVMALAGFYCKSCQPIGIERDETSRFNRIRQIGILFIKEPRKSSIIFNPVVTTRDYSRIHIRSLTRGLCDIIHVVAVVQQETPPPYMSCLAPQRERAGTHATHTAANTKHGIGNNCNIYTCMSQVVYHSVKKFLAQILF